MKLFTNWCGKEQYHGAVTFLRDIKALLYGTFDFQAGDVFITDKKDVLVLTEESACSWRVHGCDCASSKYLGNLNRNNDREKLLKIYPELKKKL